MSEILIDDREFRVPMYGGVMTLGDVEGHPFHGNQWTGGLGSLLDRISAPDSGFTYSMVTGHEPKTGYVLSIHKDREQALDLDKLTLENLVDYSERNADLLTQPQNYLGAWHDPDSHRVFLDVSSVTPDAAEAARLAQEHDQLAYFDLSTMTSVPVAPKLKAAHGQEDTSPTHHRLLRRADREADTGRSDRALHQVERPSAVRGGDRAGTRADGVRSLGGVGSGNFGHGGRPGEVGGSSTVQLFHGTASSAIASIKAQGLRPAAGKGGDAWWKITRGQDFNDPRRTIFSDALKANPALFDDRKASVYLIDDPSLAQHFADYATELHPDAEPVVLEVDIPKSAVELTKDEGTASQYGAFRFKGTIKPEWIRGRVTFTRSGKHTVKALAEAATYRVYLAFVVDNEEVRTAASRRAEGPLHKLADSHVSKLSVALRYAFAKGRKALKSDPVKNVEAAVKAVADALREVLPGTLIKIAADGGRMAVDVLPQMRTAKRQDKPEKRVGPLKMSFDQTNQRVIDWADRHAAELIDGISETTRDAINNAVAEALEQGSIKDLYDEILDAVGDEARADLIARTEVMTAANEGQREGWRQAVDEGLLPETATVAWIATGDDGVCPLCEALDGETRDIDGEYPDDGGEGPPLHPRCRCTEGIIG